MRIFFPFPSLQEFTDTNGSKFQKQEVGRRPLTYVYKALSITTAISASKGKDGGLLKESGSLVLFAFVVVSDFAIPNGKSRFKRDKDDYFRNLSSYTKAHNLYFSIVSSFKLQ